MARFKGGVISATPPSTTYTTAGGAWRGNEVAQAIASGAWPQIPALLDPQFNLTSLLIHADNTNNANNNTFIDSSGAYIPFSGTYSNFFNGSAYFYVPSSASLSPGTGDFTVEAFVLFTSLPAASGVGSIFQNDAVGSSTSDKFWVGLYNNAGTYRLNIGQHNTANAAYVNWTPLINTWYHIAVVRQSGTVLMFIDGVQQTVTSSTVYNGVSFGQNGASVGGISTPAYLNGFISNLRYIVGTAFYTAGFTRPSAPLTAVTNTQLLTCQSTTLADNSASARTITNTNVTISSGGVSNIALTSKPYQGTFTPFSQAGWSNYFNGSADYFTLPASSNLTMTGDFTWEFWMYLTSYSASMHVLSNSAPNLTLQFDGVSTNSLLLFDGSNRTIGNISLNTWTHVAIVRRSGTLQAYLNGVASGSSWTNSSTTTFSMSSGYVGARWTPSNYFNGYISNLRILNGTGLYSSNFTPSTTSLSAITNTTLLVCQSNRFVDNSSSPLTITPSGTTAVIPFSPFAPTSSYSTTSIGGSAYFDNSSSIDIATFPFQIGSSDFTMEFWAYPTAATSTNWNPMVVLGMSGGGKELRISQNINNTGWGWLYPNNAGSADVYTGYGTLQINTWHHFAMSRVGSNLYLYRNGVQVATATSISFNLTNMDLLRIGGSQAAYSTDGRFTGYISGLRIVKGGLYPSGFTVPNSPPTAVSNTVLLAYNTNATIIDQAGKNDLATFGSAVISTSQSKFGGSSMYFPGTTSDYVGVPYKQDFLLGTGDFTIECWFYNSATQNNNSGLFSFLTGTTFFLIHNNLTSYPNLLTVYVDNYGGGTRVLTGTTTLSTGQWYHMAITRSSGVWRLFLNGVQEGSTYTNTAEPVPASALLRIGLGNGAGYIGYIDEFRISKYARYTANFTPALYAFANQ